MDRMETRLTVELVPSTCWYANVRSNVSQAVWDRLRRRVAAEAGHRCEICGGRGRRWPVECHEAWHYDDATKVQRLERLVALCPACHEVKHPGLASKRGHLPAVIQRLAVVNGWSEDDAAVYLEAVFEQWAARSRHQWRLDISVLAERYGVDEAGV
jgi:5-methylcytosine-specific restriction endonuclease McrA